MEYRPGRFAAAQIIILEVVLLFAALGILIFLSK